MVDPELRGRPEGEPELSLQGVAERGIGPLGWLVVHRGPQLELRGPGEPFQPLALEPQLGLVGVERQVVEQLERLLPRHDELCLAAQLHLERGFERSVQQASVPVPVELRREGGPDLHHGAVRPPHQLDLLLELADAHALHEAELRLERRAQVEIGGAVVEVAPVPQQVRVPAGARRARAGRIPRAGGDRLAGEHPGLAQREPGIRGDDAVPGAAQRPVAPEHPDRRLAAQLALDAQRRDARLVDPERPGGRAVVDPDCADPPAARLAREPHPLPGVRDPPREEQVHRRLEVARVFDEEGPLLGEEHLEAFVDGHLGLVGLDLAEVGIHRAVERERAAQHRLGVEPDAQVVLAAECRDAGIQKPRTGERAVRVEPDVASRGDVLQSL